MDAEQARVEHLKLIASVIDRLSRLSFAVKASATTLVGALIAATAALDSPFVALGILTVPVFWSIDGFYLWQERYFRDLFRTVRRSPLAPPGSESYFTMDIDALRKPLPDVAKTMFRWHLLMFYSALAILGVGVALGAAFSDL